jgi:hypothetical protein
VVGRDAQSVPLLSLAGERANPLLNRRDLILGATVLAVCLDRCWQWAWGEISARLITGGHSASPGRRASCWTFRSACGVGRTDACVAPGGVTLLERLKAMSPARFRQAPGRGR